MGATPLDIISLLKAMAHPERFRVLSRLCDGEACFGDLQALLHRRQAYVSQQLARLRGARLIRCRRGDTFYYSLASPIILVTLRILQAFWGSQPSVGGGTHFRVQGPILEHNILPMLYGVLQGHPCNIGDLVVFVPALKTPQHETNLCTMDFMLFPQDEQADMRICPDIITGVLEQMGCQVVADEVSVPGPASSEL